MVHPAISPTSEGLILDLLSARKSLTLEQVVNLLPELSWNQIFSSQNKTNDVTSTESRECTGQV